MIFIVKIRDISAKFSFFFSAKNANLMLPSCRSPKRKLRYRIGLSISSCTCYPQKRRHGFGITCWSLKERDHLDAGFVGWLRKCTENPCKNLVFFAFLRQEFHWNSQRNCCCLERKPLGHDWGWYGWYVLCGCYLVWGSSKNHEHQNSNAEFLGAYFRHN